MAEEPDYEGLPPNAGLMVSEAPLTPRRVILQSNISMDFRLTCSLALSSVVTSFARSFFCSFLP